MTVVLDARVVVGTGGGPDKTILNQPRFLARSGYRNLCAYMHPPDDPGFDQLRRRAEAWDAPLISVPDRGPFDRGVAARLLEVCRREKVAIWHGHDYKSNALGLLLRREWPMRLVTTVHGWVRHTRRTPLYYAIDRLCLPRYERVLCVSDDLVEQCSARGVPAGRCVLLENGIDTDEFRRRRDINEAKAALGFDPDRPLIGAVGRLSPEKGFGSLIRAADRLLRDGVALDLAIAGEGDEFDRLNDLIVSLNRRGQFRLLGFRADVRELYEAFDVFTLSSHREGLPNVVLEAMAAGVPVVATRIAGMPRLIEHDANGVLVEAGSEEGLAGALGRLLKDADLRERLGREGRSTIEARYGFAARMEKVAAIYDELLAPRVEGAS